MAAKNVRIAVVGGGIGGLTAAGACWPVSTSG